MDKKHNDIQEKLIELIDILISGYIESGASPEELRALAELVNLSLEMEALKN